MKTPDFKDRLSAASAAKKSQLERARVIAEDPERLKRIKPRSEIIAARNNRIAERERNRREAIEREVAEQSAGWRSVQKSTISANRIRAKIALKKEGGFLRDAGSSGHAAPQ
jgi:hypothetical protein